MLKHTVTYEDLDGNTVKEDLFFNLSISELTRIDAKYPGGIEKAIAEFAETEDRLGILELFETVITTAYGVRREDGRGFIKPQENLELFKTSLAYDALFIDLLSDEKAAVRFFNALAPKVQDKNNGKTNEVIRR